MKEQEPILYHVDKGIARLTFNRPEASNAMDPDLLHEMASLLDKVRTDDGLK